MTSPNGRWIVVGGLVGTTILVTLAAVVGTRVRAERDLHDQRIGELVYQVLYPADFAGDRRVIADRIVNVLGPRLVRAGYPRVKCEVLPPSRVRILISGVEEKRFLASQSFISPEAGLPLPVGRIEAGKAEAWVPEAVSYVDMTRK